MSGFDSFDFLADSGNTTFPTFSDRCLLLEATYKTFLLWLAQCYPEIAQAKRILLIDCNLGIASFELDDYSLSKEDKTWQAIANKCKLSLGCSQVLVYCGNQLVKDQQLNSPKDIPMTTTIATNNETSEIAYERSSGSDKEQEFFLPEQFNTFNSSSAFNDQQVMSLQEVTEALCHKGINPEKVMTSLISRELGMLLASQIVSYLSQDILGAFMQIPSGGKENTAVESYQGVSTKAVLPSTQVNQDNPRMNFPRNYEAAVRNDIHGHDKFAISLARALGSTKYLKGLERIIAGTEDLNWWNRLLEQSYPSLNTQEKIASFRQAAQSLWQEYQEHPEKRPRIRRKTTKKSSKQTDAGS